MCVIRVCTCLFVYASVPACSGPSSCSCTPTRAHTHTLTCTSSRTKHPFLPHKIIPSPSSLLSPCDNGSRRVVSSWLRLPSSMYLRSPSVATPRTDSACTTCRLALSVRPYCSMIARAGRMIEGDRADSTENGTGVHSTSLKAWLMANLDNAGKAASNRCCSWFSASFCTM